MTENGLEIKVTIEDFATKKSDEKLNILYQAILAQQKTCHGVAGEFHNKILNLEMNRKLGKAKLTGISIGSGGGAAALYGVIKSWLSGGG